MHSIIPVNYHSSGPAIISLIDNSQRQHESIVTIK